MVILGPIESVQNEVDSASADETRCGDGQASTGESDTESSRKTRRARINTESLQGTIVFIFRHDGMKQVSSVT
jgi:hypothetical protein